MIVVNWLDVVTESFFFLGVHVYVFNVSAHLFQGLLVVHTKGKKLGNGFISPVYLLAVVAGGLADCGLYINILHLRISI